MPNLVGIGNSQVPTNAMLGGLAYQDSVGEIDIDKIKARTGDNATDIFVYDTRKDSDGGAWRKRTKHTSWYNELPSSTRGARKEFPVVAVIVVSVNPDYDVTIYDGDDPNLPMWMYYSKGNQDPFLDYSDPGSNHLGNYEPRSVTALNGIICVGCLRSAGQLSNLNGGLREFHFIEDTAYATNNDKRVKFSTPISERNTIMTQYYQHSSQTIRGSNVRDVAMTVLPDAIISPTTGLPKPIIAVATESGTSIIRYDVITSSGYVTTIADIVYSGSPNTRYVDFRKFDNALVMSMDSNGSYVHVIYDIPTADVSGSHQYQKEAIDDEFYRTGSSQDWNQDLWINGLSPFGDSVRIANNVISGNRGINVLLPYRDSASESAVAVIRSSYNTGYMFADCRGAFISDTDSTDVTDTELITNYDFTNGITGWTTQLNGASGGSPGITVSSNKLVFQQGSSNSVWLVAYQTITTVVGKRYLLNIDIASTNQSANWRIYAASTKILGYPDYLSQGSHTAEFVATSTSTMIQIQQGGSANTSGEVNSLSVRLVEEDRRNQGAKSLQVYGTINRAPVATGAELVSYQPADSNSYLQHDNLNDTGINWSNAWYMMYWYDTHGKMAIEEFNTGGYNNTVLLAAIDADGIYLRSKLGGIGTSNLTVRNHGWNQFAAVYNGKDKLKVYKNSLEISEYSVTYSNQNARIILLANSYNNNGGSYANRNYSVSTNAKMALARVGLGAPSPDQLRKMWIDEKMLFNENAKATIHGTSDEVTGLAFDDSRNILHVGTSAGRSEFSQLTRINNTTTAVTTAISASNELVAEQ